MPTYQWKCRECKAEIEITKSVKNYAEPPPGSCPNCGAQDWEKLLNPSIIRWRYCDKED